MTDIGDIGSDQWTAFILRSADQMGIELAEKDLEKITAHCDVLIKWNKTTNLTRIVDPVEVAVKHVLDSMASLPFIPKGASVLDAGSGGGFPGMVLKIVNPSLNITLIDASRKKISFLQHVIRTLRLQDISALQRRTENLVKLKDFRNAFDVVVSRSFAALDVFFKDAVHLLSAGGKIIAYKQKEVEKEILMLEKMPEMSDFVLEVRSYALPCLELERALVVMKRKDQKMGEEG